MSALKAAIYDKNDRRGESFKAAFTKAGWEDYNVDRFIEVFEDDGSLRIPGEHNLIMLHLRGPDNEKKNCGNVDSWKYLESIAQLPNAAKTCLIAYTGGGVDTCPEPDGFKEYREQKLPWRYFNGVNKPQDINLEVFAKEWSTHPDNDPPLELLSFNPRIGALKLLILGFQRGHEGNNDALVKMRNWTESSDWWQPVVGEDSRGQTLIDALNNAGEKRFVELASELVAFCSQPEDKANTLPLELKEKLCAFPLGNEAAA